MATLDWDYGVVSFIDILGFSSLVESDAGAVAPANLGRIVSCLTAAKSGKAAQGLDVRAFSDSIVVSGPLAASTIVDVISAVADLQRLFVDGRVLLRGGIAFGKHFSSADIIYSEALVRAYEIERDRARFPRVVVDHNLIDWFRAEGRAGQTAVEAVLKLLLRDRDGQLFINYLDIGRLASHASFLGSYDVSVMTASVLEKLQWLTAYHNYVANVAGSDHVVGGPLAGGFQPL